MPEALSMVSCFGVVIRIKVKFQNIKDIKELFGEINVLIMVEIFEETMLENPCLVSVKITGSEFDVGRDGGTEYK